MPQIPSAPGSGMSRAGPIAGPHFAPATTRSRSRMTIRLPDVSIHAEIGRETDQELAHTGVAVLPAEARATLDPSEHGESGTRSEAGWRSTRPLEHPFVQKCVAYVRQPKFWLACLAAVAVQVLLAAVMTPADDEPPEPRQTSAKRWSKPAAAPATRIVVPPAQTPADAEPAEGLKNGTTTPLGVTAPLDGLSEVNGRTGQGSGDTEPFELLTPPTRMAENRRLADAGQHFDGRNAESNQGATLGAIVPLEQSPEQNRNEHP